MMKKRLIRTFVIILVGVFVGGLVTFVMRNHETSSTTGVIAKNFGGAYTLTDHHGNQVTQDSYPGQWKLMFFGFTFCPAICPTELTKMQDVLMQLGPQAEKIQPLFITVDPARDTQDVLADYVSAFHPRLIGLRGSEAQTEKIKKLYKVYSKKVPMEGMGEDQYMVDHSTFTYLMDPQGNLQALYKLSDTPEYIANDLKNRLK